VKPLPLVIHDMGSHHNSKREVFFWSARKNLPLHICFESCIQEAAEPFLDEEEPTYIIYVVYSRIWQAQNSPLEYK
jgi:hypothetical protein